jgi:hypothetical protein
VGFEEDFGRWSSLGRASRKRSRVFESGTSRAPVRCERSRTSPIQKEVGRRDRAVAWLAGRSHFLIHEEPAEPDARANAHNGSFQHSISPAARGSALTWGKKMEAKEYNRLFAEAGELAERRAVQLGRAQLPADVRVAADEVYLKWVAEEKFDTLLSALNGMFNSISILSYRLEFLVDLAIEFERRGDIKRIIMLFECTVPGVWKCYLQEKQHADKGMFGNIAEAATRKAELLTMLYRYFEAVHRLGNFRLAEKIKREALRFSREEKFDPKMKSWRVAQDAPK